MGQPCCVTSFCFDPANPLENFSSERPDQELFIGYNSGWGGFEPPINGSWGTLGCISFCQSTVSQSDADNCAANQQIACTVNKCNDASCGGNGGGGWQDENGNPVTLFSNGPAACTILCPDGLPFVFRVPAGSIQAPNQAYADAVAQSIACIEGQSERMCMNNIASGACSGEFYGDVIFTEGGTAPIVYSIVSGSLPPGFTFVQEDEFSVDIFGYCFTPGNYTFSVRATDRFGIFMIKSYTIGVVAITNAPGPATQNSAYSFQFTAAGGTPPYTFSLTGSLPDGLTMTSGGLISGTPTTQQTSSFSVTVTDSSP